VALAFLVQENLEHVMSHGHAPGIGALFGTEYPLALPVIAFVSGLAALLAAAVGSVERDLVTVIAAAILRAFRHPPRSIPRPPLRLTIPGLSPLARSRADRAPPLSLPQPS
jgi:hypothetical protein